MRISDWSSDVCSSDLQRDVRLHDGQQHIDDGRHAVEVAGTKLAFEDMGVARLTDDRKALATLRLHRSHRGRYQQVTSGPCELRCVSIKRSQERRVGQE